MTTPLLGFRSKGVDTDVIIDLLEKWASIPHEILPVTSEIAIDALNLYRMYGGPRKLHYFDTFHVAKS
ncbi:MAG: hypothetical protein J7L55_05840 [Desulfurococcales archaeon]|nr:hypothetical protein [Desulfurococcales archaeon]